VVVMATGRARLRFGWFAYMLEQLARHLVHADAQEFLRRAIRIIRALVDGEHILHLGDEPSILRRRNDPLLVQMRFESVF
jgi:hypothetical protein